jgi:ribose transport system permease protein
MAGRLMTETWRPDRVSMTEHRRDVGGVGLEGHSSRPAARDEVSTSVAKNGLGRLELGRYSGLFLTIVLVAIFAARIPDTFLTTTTAQAIARNQAITLVLSLSLMISLCAGYFDLSVGQNVGLGAVACISLVSDHHWGTVSAMALTIVMCGAIGGVNALLVVGLGMDSFIATLGVGSILLALSQYFSDAQYVGPAPAGFQTLAGWQPFGIPVLTVYALILAAVVWYVLEHTPIGRRLYATGANPDASRLAGIATKRYAAAALVLTGLGCGIAAVLMSAAVGSVSPSVGSSYLLPPFAACVLAATQIKPGRYNVGGLLVALILLGVGVKGLALIDGSVWIPDLFNGAALILAVGLTVLARRQALRRSKRRAVAAETSQAELA